MRTKFSCILRVHHLANITENSIKTWTHTSHNITLMCKILSSNLHICIILLGYMSNFFYNFLIFARWCVHHQMSGNKTGWHQFACFWPVTFQFANTQESEDRLRLMPAVADEAIDILVNSYKSSNTSEVAKQDMRHINEMVSALNLCTYYIYMYNILIHNYTCLWYMSQVMFIFF